MSPPATPQWLWRALETPLGTLWMAASEAGLAGAWFAGQRHEPAIEEHQRRATPTWAQGPAGSAAHAALERASAQLQRYFVDPSVSFDLPLDPSRGTGFQQAVWQALRRIPAGATLSYAALAEQVGRPRAVRAVGAAVGRNPWSVIVPCHRVLGSDGALTGYAGGLDRKQTLLQWERAGNPASRRRAGGTATRTQAVAA